MAGFDDPLTMALLGASAGFLDPRGGMMGGFRGALEGLQAGNELKQKDLLAHRMQQKLTRQMDADQMLKDVLARQQQAGDMHPASIGNALISTGHPDLVNQGLGIMKDFRAKVKTTNKVMKGGQVFTQPVFDNGTFGELNELPSAEKLMTVNTGNQALLVNQMTGQPTAWFGIGMSPGEAARLSQAERQFGVSHGLAQDRLALDQARTALELNPEFQARKAASIASGKEQGVNQVKAAADLPRTIEQGQQTIQLVDDLLKHPGFKMSVGKSAPIGSALSFMPGTDEASFDIALNQLKGKQFLEAFESLKGGGAITEIEGQKAQQAISRMEKANREDEFIKASREFQGIIRQGINRAKMKAGGSVIQQPVNINGYSVERLD